MKSPQDVDPDVRQLVEAELYSGETFLWAGKSTLARAIRKELFSKSGTVPGMASLVILGLAVVFAGMFASREVSPINIFVLLFLSLSIATVLMPIWNIVRSRRVVYALTDQRALIIVQGLSGGMSIKSYGAVDIDRIERRINRDGSGDIIFAREHRTGTGARSGLSGDLAYLEEIGFWGVPDARQVELLMLETFKRHDSGSKQKQQDNALDNDALYYTDDDHPIGVETSNNRIDRKG